MTKIDEITEVLEDYNALKKDIDVRAETWRPPYQYRVEAQLNLRYHFSPTKLQSYLSRIFGKVIEIYEPDHSVTFVVEFEDL